jgi:hypothetical protein
MILEVGEVNSLTAAHGGGATTSVRRIGTTKGSEEEEIKRAENITSLWVSTYHFNWHRVSLSKEQCLAGHA